MTTIPPKPDHPPTVPLGSTDTDWVDSAVTAAREQHTPEAPVWLQAQPAYYPPVHTPAFLTAVPEKVSTALSPKTRSALYNASAAGAGWLLGLEPLIGRALASCGAEAGLLPALIVGCTTCLLTAHLWDRRTRHWWVGLAWAARIPLASAITALALYTPATQL